MFKVGDRVVHEDKGPATVIYCSAKEMLLELDHEVGSVFYLALADIPLRGYIHKDGKYYWRPSQHLCTPARTKFKGNK